MSEISKAPSFNSFCVLQKILNIILFDSKHFYFIDSLLIHGIRPKKSCDCRIEIPFTDWKTLVFRTHLYLCFRLYLSYFHRNELHNFYALFRTLFEKKAYACQSDASSIAASRIFVQLKSREASVLDGM